MANPKLWQDSPPWSAAEFKSFIDELSSGRAILNEICPAELTRCRDNNLPKIVKVTPYHARKALGCTRTYTALRSCP